MADDFLDCMRQVEEGFESDDVNVRRAALRRTGVHLMRIHEKLELIIAEHQIDGREMDVRKAYATLMRLERAVFGDAEEGNLEQKEKGLLGLYRDLEAQRKLLTRILYGVIGVIGLVGLPELWALVKGIVG